MGLSVAIKNVEHAMNEIENEQSLHSMEERFDDLMQAMIANAWRLMKQQSSKGTKPTKQEKEFQEEAMKQLHYIDKVFSIAKKHKRIGNAPNMNFDKQLVQKIKHLESTIGEIVARLPDIKK